MAQKSWPSDAPRRAPPPPAARRARARPSIATPVPVGRSSRSSSSKTSAGQGVDAGVAGADQRHAGLRRRGRGPARARASSSRQRRRVQALAGDQVGDQVEIEAVADDVVGLAQRLRRLGGAPAGAARADADDGEPAARPADRGGIDGARQRGRRRRWRARERCLGDDQRRLRPGGGQRRALGDAMAADLAEDDLGRIGQPRRLALQLGRGEEAGGTPSACADRMDRRLVRLQVERGDAGDRRRGETMLPRACRATSAITSSGAAPRSQPTPTARTGGCSTSVAAGSATVGDRRESVTDHSHCRSSAKARPATAASRRRRPRRGARTGSPASSAAVTAFAASGLAMRQPGGGSSRPKPRRTSPAVVIGGDAAGGRGDGAGEPVGAVMAAEQRHRDAAVLGDGDDRRLAALVGEQRRDGADQDAGGADADDRRAGGEQRAQVRDRVGERLRRRHRRARPGRAPACPAAAAADAAPAPARPAAERDERRARRQSRRRRRLGGPAGGRGSSRSRGASSSARSRSGRMRWSAKVARST